MEFRDPSLVRLPILSAQCRRFSLSGSARWIHRRAAWTRGVAGVLYVGQLTII